MAPSTDVPYHIRLQPNVTPPDWSAVFSSSQPSFGKDENFSSAEGFNTDFNAEFLSIPRYRFNKINHIHQILQARVSRRASTFRNSLYRPRRRKYWPSPNNISVCSEELLAEVLYIREASKQGLGMQTPQFRPRVPLRVQPSDRPPSQLKGRKPDCTFNVARRAGYLMPDPLTQDQFFGCSREGRYIRQVEIWGPVCNLLSRKGEIATLLSLRLVSRQFCMMASFSIRQAGISIIPPDEQDQTSYLDDCRYITPPLMPQTPNKRASVEYSVGKVLELVPRGSSGWTVLKVKIHQQRDVGPRRDCQIVAGQIIEITDWVGEITEGEHERLKKLIGRPVEIRLYDPTYLRLDVQGFSEKSVTDTELAESIPRREAAFWNYMGDKRPLELLGEWTITSQKSPLVKPAVFCRYFAPEREIAGERGVAAIIWEPSQGVPLRDYAKLQNVEHSTDAVISSCISVVREVLQSGGSFWDLVASGVVELDGSIHVNHWDTFQCSLEPWENGENDPDWHAFVGEEINRLMDQLAAVEMISSSM
jgi:hypothetical protein